MERGGRKGGKGERKREGQKQVRERLHVHVCMKWMEQKNKN